MNLFSYRALPTITPKSPEFSNLTKDNKSEIEPTPPEAITGTSVISRILFVNFSFEAPSYSGQSVIDSPQLGGISESETFYIEYCGSRVTYSHVFGLPPIW